MTQLAQATAADSVVPGAQLLAWREVPLGGLRAMTVRRTLPQRARSTIGAWCFLDHYGPDNVAVTGGMKVPPHPHTGLQTVSWLFSGQVEHRDSLGTHAVVQPGELNLMTAGYGISHSEDSTPATTVLHGVQLWTVLPLRFKDMAPQFEHFVPEVHEIGGARLRVFIGSLAGASSPVRVFTPLVGAELAMPPKSHVTLDLAGSFEHGYLLDEGVAEVDGIVLGRSDLLYLPPGRHGVRIRAGAGGARLILVGGLPFDEEIVMWWNFIGRSHDDVVAARARWQSEIGADDDGGLDWDGGTGDGVVAGSGDARFGLPGGYATGPLPAPVLPNQRLKPRANPTSA